MGCRSRNQALVIAGWRWSIPVAALTLNIGVFPHYLRIYGSCDVAWAPVATVSPSEFIPVASGLLGLALPFMSKFPLLVMHGLGRGLVVSFLE